MAFSGHGLPMKEKLARRSDGASAERKLQASEGAAKPAVTSGSNPISQVKVNAEERPQGYWGL